MFCKRSLLLFPFAFSLPSPSSFFACHAGYKLRTQPTFRDARNGFLTEWRLRNKLRNSTLMSHPSDWTCRVKHLLQPIRSTTQIWEVTRYQNRISVLVSQTSVRVKTTGGVVKCRLFSQATQDIIWPPNHYDHRPSTIDSFGLPSHYNPHNCIPLIRPVKFLVRLAE